MKEARTSRNGGKGIAPINKVKESSGITTAISSVVRADKVSLVSESKKGLPSLTPDVHTPTENSNCSHFWKIPTPDGPTSRGVCRCCGGIREFFNTFTEAIGQEKKE